MKKRTNEVEKTQTAPAARRSQWSPVGRRKFLAALGKYDPARLQSLLDDVFVPHRHTWQQFLAIDCDGSLAVRPDRALAEIERLWQTNTVNKGEFAALRALFDWADNHRFGSTRWLTESILYTIRCWLVKSDMPLEWQYWPAEFDPRPFAVEFGIWVPSESVTRTRVRITWTAVFQEQLETYLKAVEAAYDARPDSSVNDHVDWTALRFMGKTPAEIVKKWPSGKIRAYRFPEDAVRNAISRFSRKIGLKISPGLRMGQNAVTEHPRMS